MSLISYELQNTFGGLPLQNTEPLSFTMGGVFTLCLNYDFGYNIDTGSQEVYLDISMFRKVPTPHPQTGGIPNEGYFGLFNSGIPATATSLGYITSNNNLYNYDVTIQRTGIQQAQIKITGVAHFDIDLYLSELASINNTYALISGHITGTDTNNTEASAYNQTETASFYLYGTDGGAGTVSLNDNLIVDNRYYNENQDFDLTGFSTDACSNQLSTIEPTELTFNITAPTGANTARIYRISTNNLISNLNGFESDLDYQFVTAITVTGTGVYNITVPPIPSGSYRYIVELYNTFSKYNTYITENLTTCNDQSDPCSADVQSRIINYNRDEITDCAIASPYERIRVCVDLDEVQYNTCLSGKGLGGSLLTDLKSIALYKDGVLVDQTLPQTGSDYTQTNNNEGEIILNTDLVGFPKYFYEFRTGEPSTCNFQWVFNYQYDNGATESFTYDQRVIVQDFDNNLAVPVFDNVVFSDADGAIGETICSNDSVIKIEFDVTIPLGADMNMNTYFKDVEHNTSAGIFSMLNDPRILLVNPPVVTQGTTQTVEVLVFTEALELNKQEQICIIGTR